MIKKEEHISYNKYLKIIGLEYFYGLGTSNGTNMENVLNVIDEEKVKKHIFCFYFSWERNENQSLIYVNEKEFKDLIIYCKSLIRKNKLKRILK